jgi:hypothetical protein
VPSDLSNLCTTPKPGSIFPLVGKLDNVPGDSTGQQKELIDMIEYLVVEKHKAELLSNQKSKGKIVTNLKNQKHKINFFSEKLLHDDYVEQ